MSPQYIAANYPPQHLMDMIAQHPADQPRDLQPSRTSAADAIALAEMIATIIGQPVHIIEAWDSRRIAIVLQDAIPVGWAEMARIEPTNAIIIYRDRSARSWIADFRQHHTAAACREGFGTTEIPMPYSPEAPEYTVITATTRRNPDARIIRGYDR